MNRNHNKNFWAAYAAAVWALLFAVLHVVWAFGWYVGLDAEQARRAFQQNWFLVYDLIAAAMCAFGVIIVLAIIRSWERVVPRRILKLLLWFGTGLLVLRGAAGIIKIIYLAATGRNILETAALWDVWFCLGALLFCLTIWQFRNLKIIG